MPLLSNLLPLSVKFIFEVVSGTLLMQTTIFILLLNLVKVCKFNENKENNKKGGFIFWRE